MKAEDTVESNTNNGLWYYTRGLECTVEVVNGLQVVTQKKKYQKAPLWAGNEPGCSACSGHCSEKHNFGYFLHQTFLTLIKLSFRYCKVPVKMVSECWAVAWKWWVIKLLGKIFWQESVRRVDSILGIIFSSSVICITSPVQTQEGSHCPQPQVGRLLAGRMGLAVSPRRAGAAVAPAIPSSPAGISGSRSAHAGLSSPQQLLPLGSPCPWGSGSIPLPGVLMLSPQRSLWSGPAAPYM